MTSPKSCSLFQRGEIAGTRRLNWDQLLLSILWPTAAMTSVIAAAIVVVIAANAAPGLVKVGLPHFVTDSSWHPAVGEFNLAPMIFSTFAVACAATSISAVLGIFSAIFCCFYAPPSIGSAYRFLISLMAGVPSVIFGLWGLTVLVPLIAVIEPPGASILAAILILTLMVLPTVTVVATASLRAISPSLLVGAEALGFSRWTTATKIALPAARRGIATSIVLATGRALGETMAVLMVSGNIVQMPHSLFDPVRTLAANIALEIPYAQGVHRASLFVSALALIAIVFITVFLLELFSPERAND